MAGSYKHCVAEDGQLLVNEDLIKMVETLGDAYEAIEEMYGMIWWMASTMYSEIGFRWSFVEHARKNYLLGLTHSPGTDGHLQEDDDE